jgi:hypothetical protein
MRGENVLLTGEEKKRSRESVLMIGEVGFVKWEVILKIGEVIFTTEDTELHRGARRGGIVH